MKVEQDAKLHKLTTLGAGGRARWFAKPETVHDLVELLGWAEGNGVPVAVVGLGSNLLVADEGFDGLLLKLAGTLAYAKSGDREKGETNLTGGGGAPLAVCLHRARDAGLGGLEFACAIPGTVGGAVWMNAGAYGGDIGGNPRPRARRDRRGHEVADPGRAGARVPALESSPWTGSRRGRAPARSAARGGDPRASSPRCRQSGRRLSRRTNERSEASSRTRPTT